MYDRPGKNLEGSTDITKIEERLNIKYDKLQADAIKQAAMSKVLVLTGGPGTGKTTVTHPLQAGFHYFSGIPLEVCILKGGV